MSDLDDLLNKKCADGQLGVDDADEVRHFADFLTEAGKPGSRQGFEAWRKYYPEEYQLALREEQARKQQAALEEALAPIVSERDAIRAAMGRDGDALEGDGRD